MKPIIAIIVQQHYYYYYYYYYTLNNMHCVCERSSSVIVIEMLMFPDCVDHELVQSFLRNKPFDCV